MTKPGDVTGLDPDRVRYSDAVRAYASGDLDACLERCGLVAVRDPDRAAKLALLRARALLRLERPREALDALRAGGLATTAAPADAVAERVLRASAWIALGRSDEALALLNVTAPLAGGPPALRPELALARAAACDALGEPDAALRALAEVAEFDDDLYPAALAHRARLARRANRLAEAKRLLREAAVFSARCRTEDRFVELAILRDLAALAAQALDRETGAFLEGRLAGREAYVPALLARRAAIGYHLSLLGELRAGPTAAVSPLWRGMLGDFEATKQPIVRLCTSVRRSALGRVWREPLHRSTELLAARQYLGELGLGALRDEELAVAYAVVEESAFAGHLLYARSLLCAIRAAHPKLAPDGARAAQLVYLDGVLHEAEGRAAAAAARYRAAFASARELGCARLAYLAALRLAVLAAEPYFRHYVRRAGAQGEPDSVLRAAAAELSEIDVVVRSLPVLERRILGAVCRFACDADAAAECGTEPAVVKRVLPRLYRRLGVANRKQLWRKVDRTVRRRQDERRYAESVARYCGDDRVRPLRPG